jgi:hypothetical protein
MVSANSYNINAQVIKVNMIIKQNPVVAVCTGACLCLRGEEVNLELHEFLAPKLGSQLLARRRRQPKSKCNACL